MSVQLSKPVVLKYAKIDAPSIVIASSIKPKRKGTSKFIPLVYCVDDSKTAIMYMQTANLIVKTAPFRIRGQWYIDLTIPESEEDFFQTCHDITNRVIEIMTYTGAGTDEEFRMMMNQWIMTDPNKMNEPFIRVPLSTKKNGNVNYQICKRVGRKYEMISSYELDVGKEISCLMRLQGLLIRPSSFKILWKIDQIRCNERREQHSFVDPIMYDLSTSQHEIVLDGPAFQESDDEDDAGMQSEYEAFACADVV